MINGNKWTVPWRARAGAYMVRGVLLALTQTSLTVLMASPMTAQAQNAGSARGGSAEARSLEMVPFLQRTPKEQTQQALMAAVERGAYADVGPNGPDGNRFMASAWAVLHNSAGMPQFANSSQAQIFSSTLLSVVQAINQATWERVGDQPPQFGAVIRDFRQASSYANQMRNLLDPFTLQFCGSQTSQCVQVLEGWVQDVGGASVRGAQRIQSARVAQWQKEQQGVAELERQREAQQRAVQKAQEQAKNDAAAADIAAQTARIRAKQSAGSSGGAARGQ